MQKHITEPVNIDALAKAMFISRTHLAVKFRKESSITLTEFVIKEKIEEGKRLLRYSDKPISSIADYLEFSSQGISLISLKNMRNVRLMNIELMISNPFCFILIKLLESRLLR